jgi:hypothetical protein
MDPRIQAEEARAAAPDAAQAEAPARSISAQVGMLRVTRTIPVAQAVPPESDLHGKGMPWLGAILSLALLVGCGRENVAGSACSRKALTDLGEELGRVIADRARWAEHREHDAREAANEARLRAKIAEIRAKGCGL